MPVLRSLLLALIFFSCGSDSGELPEATADQLLGRWELVEARRNNVRTETLGTPDDPGNLYLVFGPEDRFETNLLTATAQSGTFARDGAEVVVSGVELPLTYEVVALEGDNLVMRSRIQGYLFDFLLRRAAD